MNRPGAVKGRRALANAYAQVVERMPDSEAATVRRYVAELNEECAFWRLRFRAAQEQLASTKERS